MKKNNKTTTILLSLLCVSILSATIFGAVEIGKVLKEASTSSTSDGGSLISTVNESTKINIKRMSSGVDGNGYDYQVFSYTTNPPNAVDSMTASVSFADSREPEDYIVASVNVDLRQLIITCKQAFNSVCTVTLTSATSGASASIQVDYKQRMPDKIPFTGGKMETNDWGRLNIRSLMVKNVALPEEGNFTIPLVSSDFQITANNWDLNCYMNGVDFLSGHLSAHNLFKYAWERQGEPPVMDDGTIINNFITDIFDDIDLGINDTSANFKYSFLNAWSNATTTAKQRIAWRANQCNGYLPIKITNTFKYDIYENGIIVGSVSYKAPIIKTRIACSNTIYDVDLFNNSPTHLLVSSPTLKLALPQECLDDLQGSDSIYLDSTTTIF